MVDAARRSFFGYFSFTVYVKDYFLHNVKQIYDIVASN